MSVSPMPPNPHVFLDVRIGEEFVGRIVIELFRQIQPQTTENFRALCTGERGVGVSQVPLHYKGCKFHKIMPKFMVQGGDITHGDGSGGESIYGRFFPDEDLSLKHDRPGLVGMANSGPNTNGSQFYIVTVPTPHLDGKHIIFGQVVKGMGVVSVLEYVRTNESDVPAEECVIQNCGEIPPGGDFGICEQDNTEDVFPPFPDDSDLDFSNIEHIMCVAEKIRQSGNYYFRKEDYVSANAKYKKALRYLNKLHEVNELSKEQESKIASVVLPCILNSAASKLKLKRYHQALDDCDEALDLEPRHPKALFRRGQAFHGMRDYEKSMANLQQALSLSPNNKAILSEIAAVKGEMQAYKAKERKAYAKLFN
ncbi:peptidyl-prolyl cis-trans isomerase D-like isoform X1 [Dermacentor silvarum]|uniref:peptidyl-prolyl cis-trans isomerase D-like isoform X1 n=1 Tax=Dermacentor silvarum TaxID=543639 RepID=UPI00189AB15A|nr:peptidyl-prolyl cis-trans isomerase D-like isoform X1 [Dermacentor silvarum]